MLVTCDSTYLGDDALYGDISKVAMGRAINRAHSLATTAWQLAIWDTRPMKHPAGTAHDIAAWQRTGNETVVIEIAGRSAAFDDEGASSSADDATIRRRPIRALLFGDVRGFSGLRDQHLDGFIEHVLGSIATTARSSIATPWGDGLSTQRRPSQRQRHRPKPTPGRLAL